MVKPICAPSGLSEVSSTSPLKQFQCSSSSCQGRSSSASSSHACLLQAIDAVMPLALCPQVVSNMFFHLSHANFFPLTNMVFFFKYVLPFFKRVLPVKRVLPFVKYVLPFDIPPPPPPPPFVKFAFPFLKHILPFASFSCFCRICFFLLSDVFFLLSSMFFL